MTKSATSWRDFSTLVQDARVGHTLDPAVFANFVLNDLVELDAFAGLAENTSATEPENPKAQEYMRRSLRVLERLMWLGFDLDRALFWFRNFRIPPLNNKTPVMLMADDCLDVVIPELSRVFQAHNESLGELWEKVREDTIFLQEDLVRRVPMYTAFQVARTCTPDRILDSEFLVARDLAKAGTMFYVMWHRKPLLPKYQFDTSGLPKLIIETIIRLLSPHRSSWDIALWCSASNGWLSGRRPDELLETEPALVLKAAEQDVAELADM
ncbi:MAG TPA: hypothetical protein VFU13_19975 [Steroidobacteraceae bacterium]|nr:hypothetical protein [Steroidobacteraceae bacterium]